MLRHGFNHMSTITQHLRSRALHIHDVLHSRNSPIRRTYTLDTPQATKSGVERKRDIPLFIPRQTRKIYSSTHCILVDDVVTTGSTFFGAEKALRAATNCRNVEKIAFAFSGFIESLGCDRFD